MSDDPVNPLLDHLTEDARSFSTIARSWAKAAQDLPAVMMNELVSAFWRGELTDDIDALTILMTRQPFFRARPLFRVALKNSSTANLRELMSLSRKSSLAILGGRAGHPIICPRRRVCLQGWRGYCGTAAAKMTSKWTATSLDPEPGTFHPVCYWCARKHWGFIDEFKGNAPLDDVFFAQLEEAGKVQLSKWHRKLIKEALLEYGDPGPIGATPNQHRRAMLSIANHAQALLQETERHGDSKSWIEFHFTPPWVEKRGAEWWPQVTSILQSLKEEADFELYLDRQLNHARSRTGPETAE